MTDNTNTTAFAPKQIVVEKSNQYCLWFIDDISQSGKYLILKQIREAMYEKGSHAARISDENARAYTSDRFRLASKDEVLNVIRGKEESVVKESEEIKFIISAFEKYSEKITPTT